MSIVVTLPEVRLSYPDLFEAVQFRGAGAYRYGATFLVPKSSPTVAIIQNAVVAEAKRVWPEKWQEMLASFKNNGNKSCIMDGDLKDSDGYAGMLALTAKRAASQGRPTVIDRNKAALQEQDGRPYSGCFVNGKVEIWAQDGQFKGMRAGLLGVQFVRDGDHFGGGTTVSEDDFEDLSGGAIAAGSPTSTGAPDVALF